MSMELEFRGKLKFPQLSCQSFNFTTNIRILKVACPVFFFWTINGIIIIINKRKKKTTFISSFS